VLSHKWECLICLVFSFEKGAFGNEGLNQERKWSSMEKSFENKKYNACLRF
jgi:hypothetical protein